MNNKKIIASVIFALLVFLIIVIIFTVYFYSKTSNDDFDIKNNVTRGNNQEQKKISPSFSEVEKKTITGIVKNVNISKKIIIINTGLEFLDEGSGKDRTIILNKDTVIYYKKNRPIDDYENELKIFLKNIDPYLTEEDFIASVPDKQMTSIVGIDEIKENFFIKVISDSDIKAGDDIIAKEITLSTF